MVPCDTLTPRALRVTAHAICQWVLVRFELVMFGSQAERSNHYTSVAAYILQCSFIPYVCPRGAINNTPRDRGVIDSTPRVFFLSKNPSTSSRVFSRVPSLAYILQCSCIPCVLVVTSYSVHLSRTCCNVPFVYPTLLSYRGQGSSAALHMEYTDGRSLYQAACDRAYHGVIAIGHW